MVKIILQLDQSISMEKILNKFELVRLEVYKRVWVARQNIWIIQFLLVILLEDCLFQTLLNNFFHYTSVFGCPLNVFSKTHCKITIATRTSNTRSKSWAIWRSRCFNKISSCKNRWFAQISIDAFCRKTAWILVELASRIRWIRSEMNNATLTSCSNRKKPPQIPLFGEKSFKSYSHITCCI